MPITIEQVRNAVADSLVEVGHGNPHFVESVRRGEQDDGSFMRGALAVMKLVVEATAPAK